VPYNYLFLYEVFAGIKQVVYQFISDFIEEKVARWFLMYSFSFRSAMVICALAADSFDKAESNPVLRPVRLL